VSQTFDFYDARARDAEAAADRADLDNVRDRELRSAAVFRQLANQAQKVERDRRKADTDRAERRAAEAEEAAVITAARRMEAERH
jgi:hypothetical protein